jgi:hypothetical protein
MKSKLSLIALFAGLQVFAQYDLEHVKDTTQKTSGVNWFDIKQRTYVGGDLSMRFGTLTYIYAAPIIGFDFYKNLSVGATGIYQLYRFNNGGGSVLTEHTAGGGVFLRWRPLNFLLVQTEFDILNTVNYNLVLTKKRVNVPVFMLGAGYAGNMGDRAYYNVMLMYDFINDDNMPVPKFINPIPLYLRYGITFYLG